MIRLGELQLNAPIIGVLLLAGYGLGYFVWLQVAGSLLTRRERGAANEPLGVFDTFMLVPCRDEELVIGATIGALLEQDQRATIVVIDDASTDRTAQIVEAFAGQSPRVILLRRTLPNARVGKGAALNSALAVVRTLVTNSSLDPTKVLVGVMDADGRLSPGTIGHVARLFDEPRVGGVQLQVRIRNRFRLLTRIQDIGFWGTAAVAQMGRDLTGSVSLGGNGQFTRLSALNSIEGNAWSDSLTEDLDLMITLTVRGWQMRMTSLAHVEQEGPETLRALLRQRTRWAQGHMRCAARTPELVRSGLTPLRSAVELSCYLWQPWVLALPWSLLAPLLIVLAVRVVATIGQAQGAAAAFGSGAALGALAVLPALWSAWVYARRTDGYGFVRSLWMQAASVLLHVVTWLATWRAFARIVLRRDSWAKTARVGSADTSP